MQARHLLVKYLLSEGLLSKIPDDSLFNQREASAVQVLVDAGLIKEKEALEAIATHLGTDCFDLDSKEMQTCIDVSPFVSSIDAQLCHDLNAVPLYEQDGVVTIAQANPFDLEGLKSIGFSLSKQTRAAVVREQQIRELIDLSFPKLQFEMGLIDRSNEELDLTISHGSLIDQIVDVEEADAAPIVRLVNKILLDAADMDASDIHVEPTNLGVNVRFRIDGVMHKIIEVPKRLQRFMLTRIKLLAGMDISERRRAQDGRLRISHSGKSVDMRVSCIPTASGEKLVLRLLRDDYSSLTLESLGFGDELAVKIQAALGHDSKLLIVTGPTGSGKTTTLYTAINYLCDGKRNITTVEDPIEYRFHEINQMQVNTAAGVTFPSALRSILRQDPDVIMIGEIRDGETAHIAVQAAQTGHLVLSTLHTNSAPDAIVRLLDLGIERYAVAASLAGVLAQRLVRRICTGCKASIEEASITEHGAYFEKYELNWKDIKYGRGCKECNDTGFKGRLGVYSYLEVNETLSGMIQSGVPSHEMVEYARSRGFSELDEAAVALVKKGETTFGEALPYLITDRVSPTPVAVVMEQSAPVYEAEPSPAGSLEKGKVLIIDDSQMARRFVAMALKDEFVEIVEAENGSEALELLHEDIPDLILCDIQMPVLDGPGFLKKLRHRKATRDIPVLMLTAESDPNVEADLLEMGANDFISKDSNQRVILSRIRRFLADL